MATNPARRKVQIQHPELEGKPWVSITALKHMDPRWQVVADPDAPEEEREEPTESSEVNPASEQKPRERKQRAQPTKEQ